MNFKRFLTEDIDTGRFDPNKAIRVSKIVKHFTLNSDYTINVNGDVGLNAMLTREYNGGKCLSVKFKEIRGSFYAQGEDLTTMLGSPEWIGGDYQAYGNDFANLEGIPEYVSGRIALHFNPRMTTLKDINKKVRHCDGIMIPGTINTHILGILLIPGIKQVGTSNTDPTLSDETRIAAVILNRHANRDHDILEAQEELRTAGLRNYGRL